MLHVACCMLHAREEAVLPELGELRGASWTLHVACCMLHVACCMLHVACCMLHVACRMSHVACWQTVYQSSMMLMKLEFLPSDTNCFLSTQQDGSVNLFDLRDFRWHVACCMLHVACRMSHVACYMLHIGH